MTHDLKIWPQYFAALVEGKKRAELRRNDRVPTFQVGDELKLREWDPNTGRSTRASIIHIDIGGPIPSSYVLLSLSPSPR